MTVGRWLSPPLWKGSLIGFVCCLLFDVRCGWTASVPCGDVPAISGTTPEDHQWQPRTPEQTLYAYVRCLNDSSASVDMKIRWVRWQPDASAESQCYVKCVSEELRLYDPKEGRFHPERFVKQAEAFYSVDPDELQKLRSDAEPMLSGALEDDSCASVFYKYAPFYSAHTNTILRMFHGDYRDIAGTYQRLGNRVKQIGQTFVDYCQLRYDKQWNNEEPCQPDDLLDCILRGFRWITEEGEVNVNEIRRDYEATGYSTDGAERCGSMPVTTTTTTNASVLYHCLRDHDATAIGQVISRRNQQTAVYFDVTSQEEPWKSAVEFANNLV